MESCTNEDASSLPLFVTANFWKCLNRIARIRMFHRKYAEGMICSMSSLTYENLIFLSSYRGSHKKLVFCSKYKLRGILLRDLTILPFFSFLGWGQIIKVLFSGGTNQSMRAISY